MPEEGAALTLVTGLEALRQLAGHSFDRRFRVLRHEPFKTGSAQPGNLRVPDRFDRRRSKLPGNHRNLAHHLTRTKLRYRSLFPVALAGPHAQSPLNHQTQEVPGIALPE